jgi:hypothetical protein
VEIEAGLVLVTTPQARESRRGVRREEPHARVNDECRTVLDLDTNATTGQPKKARPSTARASLVGSRGCQMAAVRDGLVVRGVEDGQNPSSRSSCASLRTTPSLRKRRTSTNYEVLRR